MIFSTPFFVTVFLPAALFACWLTEKFLASRKTNPWPLVNGVLLSFSLLFYFWGEGPGLSWLLLSIVFNDIAARIVYSLPSTRSAKVVLATAIAGNLAFLGYFKYAGFAARCINVLPGIEIPVPSIALPLGISFYTFQAMSYVIDVYRKDVKPSPTILNFACYIAMFPQLVAGPIVRYVDIDNNLKNRTVSLPGAICGMRRFLAGLVKKAVVANTMGEFADAAWAYPEGGVALPADIAWVAVAAYSLQIYYDFSGYSDMAIGIGRMMGFRFLENFNYPYASSSVREFWQRWHISLSTWFRDYLYIPLGGNRKGLARTCLNSLIVFSLCGLWHGASHIFLLWGLWHGLFLSLERLFGKYFRKVAALRPLGHVYAIAVFMAGWILFRSGSVSSATVVFKSLFGLLEPGRETALLYIDMAPKFLLAFFFGILFSLPVLPKARDLLLRKYGEMPLFAVIGYWSALTALGLAAILLILGGSYNPFIYFRF